MGYHHVFLRIALIFSETCFQVLLYLCLIGIFQKSPLINPLLFFVLSGVLTFINGIFATGNLRRLTLVGINLLLLGLWLFMVTWQTDFILFTIPKEGLNILNILLVDGSILWLGFRSLYLAYRKNPPDVYSHFDWYLFLTFLVFLCMGVTKITLPGGIAWVITTVFLNFLTLYIANNTDGKANPLSVWFLAISIMMLLYLSLQSVTLFPHISETAGSVFDMLGKAFFVFFDVLVSVILWNRFKKPTSVGDSADQTVLNLALTQQTNRDSTWQQFILQGLAWLLLILVCACVLFIVYQIMRFLMSWLLERQQGGSRRPLTFKSKLSWRSTYTLVLNRLKSIQTIISLFLPINISIDLAYSQLLRWGSWKKSPRQIHETPYAYYQRLVALYPELGSELKEITSLYVAYRYSDDPCDFLAPTLKPLLRKVYLSDFYRLVIRIKRIRLIPQ